MRILHVFDHSLPLQSGYVFRSLGILGAQRSFGWKTIHLTTPRYNAGEPEEEIVDGWSFYRTPKPSGPLASEPVIREIQEMRAVKRRLDVLIAKHRPDIVHAHSPWLTGIPALLSARRANIPFVYEVRALWEDAAVDLGHSREGSLRYRTTRAVETWLMRRAGAIFTLCDSMRDEIASRGIPESRIAVVPNAIDLAKFSEARNSDSELARSLGLEGRTVLGFIGSFYHYEGLDLLLSAMTSIRAETSNVALLLVGGGPQAERLKAQAGALGLQNQVRFTGRVPHEQVRRYYDLVDIFVYPRRSMRLTELVTPLKPLEAMAEQRLVLASDVGGHRALIRDGETGLLFRANDPVALSRKVIEAVRNGGSMAAIRAAGRRFVETERTWAASAGTYRPVYEELVAQHGSVARKRYSAFRAQPQA